ncbi:MAG: hypothetical protein RBR30_05315 [Tenuifilaceae bacterium]|nr:hypothetical protein [Tenuifilaceae bacterium]
MSINRIKASRTTLVYVIIALMIIVLILILGGSDWLRSSQLNQSFGVSNWNWTQIIVSIGVGFGLGWLVFRKR